MRFMGEDEETAKRMIAEETIPVLNEEWYYEGKRKDNT
jgi:hypothetical protein